MRLSKWLSLICELSLSIQKMKRIHRALFRKRVCQLAIHAQNSNFKVVLLAFIQTLPKVVKIQEKWKCFVFKRYEFSKKLELFKTYFFK